MYKINIKIKVIENSIKENYFNKEKIEINIDGESINKELYRINKIQEINNCIIYEIQIEKIILKGDLEVIIPKGTIRDYADNKNEEKIIKNNF